MHFDGTYYGVSLGADFSLMQIHQGFILAKYIKNKYNASVIIGGNNLDYLYIFKEFYRDLLQTGIENIGYLLRGPGEVSIEKIIKKILKQRRNTWSFTNGKWRDSSKL